MVSETAVDAVIHCVNTGILLRNYFCCFLCDGVEFTVKIIILKKVIKLFNFFSR